MEKQKIILDNIPKGYLAISSGLGKGVPRSVLVLPLIFEGQVKGVLELASFEGFNPSHQALLDQLTDSIGIVLHTIEANMRTEGLLTQSQSLAHQLQTRQQELQQTNEELQEKAHLLAEQNQEVERKNAEVEYARQELEDKAKQLALTSKYKSEFLANMSHELRTPLNSLLILSDQLNKNTEGNLTAKQTDFAKTIHSSGNDLLMLINDILDLSKIESGTVMVEGSELRLEDLQRYVARTFTHVAESKNVDFMLRFHKDLPKVMFTDSKRLQQIIKNLLSNAFKFTHQGHVMLTVEPVESGWTHGNEDLNRAGQVLAFSVADTGIGIAADKQRIIFEAFQQADGSTSRKYGGTGLGLAISRELSHLLGGEIRLISRPGGGSTFTLYLPANYNAVRRKSSQIENLQKSDLKDNTKSLPVSAAPESIESHDSIEVGLVNEVGDDRDDIRPGDHVLLIVENDLSFARFLLETARDNGFKGLVTSLGAAALAMVQDYKPNAILLDIHLTDMQGWRVLERLKNDVSSRHIPICVISTDESRDRALRHGALAFVTKPIQSADILNGLFSNLKNFSSYTEKSVLVIEKDKKLSKGIELNTNRDEVKVLTVKNVKAAQKVLKEQSISCVIVDRSFSSEAEKFLNKDEEAPITSAMFGQPAIIVYDDEKVIEEEGLESRTNESLMCNVHSLDRLLDLTTLYLHCHAESLPPLARDKLLEMRESNKVLIRKKVLVVDDDARNIFALTTVLEDLQMQVISADSGRDAIKILQTEKDIDIVLMDIMMPEMDGMETIREIRKISNLKNLPIVAVTAKAMKGDREKCIEAGAWDYLSKPVDTHQMMSVLRSWLHR